MALPLAIVVGAVLLTVFYLTVVLPKRGIVGELAHDLCVSASHEDSLGVGDGALWIVLLIVLAAIAALYGLFKFCSLP